MVGSSRDFNEVPDPLERTGHQESSGRAETLRAKFSADLTGDRLSRHPEGGEPGDKPELSIHELSLEQRFAVRHAATELKELFSKADDWMAGLRQRQAQVNESQKSEVEELARGYEQKILADLKVAAQEIASRLPFSTKVKVQLFGPANQPETLTVDFPPRPQDIFISGTHAGVSAHPLHPSREGHVRQMAAQEPFTYGVTMYEILFRLKRQGV